MKILVVGSGGRESAICWKLSKSPKVSKIYFAKGNGFKNEKVENVNIDNEDIEALKDFALEKAIDLTVVGPENPLCSGIVDLFMENNLKVFGPRKNCAILEKSKSFSKEFMEKYNIDTAKYKVVTSYEEAIENLKAFTYPVVIKADGLCFGKGVFICKDNEESKEALKKIFKDRIFGNQGDVVVLEEFLTGIEASLMCSVTKDEIIPWESAKDYKKALDNDLGENTGGVGCYSRNPVLTSEVMEKINVILEKIKHGFKEENMDYRGILFIGFMIENNTPKILEFNVRLGDPETEVLLPRLESDLVDIFLKTIDNTLKKEDFKWSKKACVTVVLTSDGYPGKYEKNFKIEGLENFQGENKDNIIVFHNGTKEVNGEIYTNGGRVLSVTGISENDDDFNNAREKVYNNIPKISFSNMKYRKDIGIVEK